MRPGNHGSRILAVATSIACVLAVITSMKSAPAEYRPPAAPARLMETGLYDSTGQLDPRNLPFVPQYPLWSDGAEKRRWVRLPPDARIDVTDFDAWRFPVGARFWKEFSWRGRKVETRMIWKATEDEWVFATYLWNEDQTDALLAPETGVPNVVETFRGKRHSIPAIEDCNACHRSAPAVVLGFNALQLSDDRDPLAPHAEPLVSNAVTMRTLVLKNRLSNLRPEFAARPSRIRERSPVARAALGYLSANCGGCHNDRGLLDRLGLVLLHDVTRDTSAAANAPEPAIVTAVDKASRYVMPGADADNSRIVVPGEPERSTLLHRMKSRRPSSQMPPLGSAIPDEEAVQLVQRWIESLKTVAQ
jgi:mono/diheme cytochrome c family protein